MNCSDVFLYRGSRGWVQKDEKTARFGADQRGSGGDGGEEEAHEL
jgi:hypothetical protein